jgi:hypothetical protein
VADWVWGLGFRMLRFRVSGFGFRMLRRGGRGLVTEW